MASPSEATTCQLRVGFCTGWGIDRNCHSNRWIAVFLHWIDWNLITLAQSTGAAPPPFVFFHAFSWHGEIDDSGIGTRRTRRRTGINAEHQNQRTTNSNKNAFPSYDRSSGGGSSSSAPPAVGGPSQEQLYQALLACAAKDQSMASLVENLVPQAVSEDQEIRSQQQSLNRIRKCRQKIVKKEALVKTKKEQWTQFVEDMRRHISSEKSRHTTDVQTLEEEITELKEELAQLRSGQDKTEPDEKMDASLDELLDIDSDDKTKQLQEQLDQAKMEVQEAQNVAYAMQAQMQAIFDYQKLAAGAAVAPTMEGPMVAPNTLPTEWATHPSASQATCWGSSKRCEGTFWDSAQGEDHTKRLTLWKDTASSDPLGWCSQWPGWDGLTDNRPWVSTCWSTWYRPTARVLNERPISVRGSELGFSGSLTNLVAAGSYEALPCGANEIPSEAWHAHVPKALQLWSGCTDLIAASFTGFTGPAWISQTSIYLLCGFAILRIATWLISQSANSRRVGTLQVGRLFGRWSYYLFLYVTVMGYASGSEDEVVRASLRQRAQSCCTCSTWSWASSLAMGLSVLWASSTGSWRFLWCWNPSSWNVLHLGYLHPSHYRYGKIEMRWIPYNQWPRFGSM